VWKLPASDLKDLILRIVDSRTALVLGWGFFVLTFFGAWKVFKWQEEKHARELERLRTVKELALKGQLELPLTDGKEKP
jgi:hypothetical protein